MPAALRRDLAGDLASLRADQFKTQLQDRLPRLAAAASVKNPQGRLEI